jgi:hypothetical protein
MFFVHVNRLFVKRSFQLEIALNTRFRTIFIGLTAFFVQKQFDNPLNTTKKNLAK